MREVPRPSSTRQVAIHAAVPWSRPSKQWILCCFAGLVLTIPLNPDLFGPLTDDIVRQAVLSAAGTLLNGLAASRSGPAGFGPLPSVASNTAPSRDMIVHIPDKTGILQSRRRHNGSVPVAQIPAGDKRAIFAGHEFFRDLPPATVQRLASHARQVHYRAGRRIFSKGDEGLGLLAVLSGVVKISVESESGREIVLNLIGANEIFGEIALLDGGARTADATAHSNCELLVLDRRDLLPILMEEPVVSIKLLEVVSSRLRRTSEQVEDLSFGDLPVRLAKSLLRVADLQGTLGTPRPRIKITQKELGQTVGLSRERTNWYLRAWEKAGAISLEKGGCIINDRAQLAELADRDSVADDFRGVPGSSKPR